MSAPERVWLHFTVDGEAYWETHETLDWAQYVRDDLYEAALSREAAAHAEVARLRMLLRNGPQAPCTEPTAPLAPSPVPDSGKSPEAATGALSASTADRAPFPQERVERLEEATAFLCDRAGDLIEAVHDGNAPALRELGHFEPALARARAALSRYDSNDPGDA